MTVAALRSILGVVWVDRAAAAVGGLIGAVVRTDVLPVAEGVDAAFFLIGIIVSDMRMGSVGRVAGWLGGRRGVSNDAAALGRWSQRICNIIHDDALSDDAVLAGKVLHELGLGPAERG